MHSRPPAVGPEVRSSVATHGRAPAEDGQAGVRPGADADPA